jgi:hypothetical protein
MKNPQRVEPLAFRKLGPSTVVIELGSSRIFHELNEAASLIWELCDGKHSREEIASELAAEFEVDPAGALADTQAFLASLEEKKLIQLT